MINELIKLATHLDNKGFHKEADYLDAVIKQAKNQTGDSLRLGGHTQWNNLQVGWSVGVANGNLYSDREIKRFKKGKERPVDISDAAKLIADNLGGLGIESAPKRTVLRFVWDMGQLKNNSGTGLDEYAQKIMPNIILALKGRYDQEIINIDLLKQTDPS